MPYIFPVPLQGAPILFTELQDKLALLGLDMPFAPFKDPTRLERTGKSTYSMLLIRIITQGTIIRVHSLSVFNVIYVTYIYSDLISMNMPALFLMGCTCYSLGLHHMSVFYNNQILAIDSQFTILEILIGQCHN